ncbi:MAG: Hpt domain-containing protein [Hyphomicrobium sp.]
MPPEEQEAPVDLVHLRRFTMGDEQLELEILGLFANQLPITISALKSADSEKEWGMAAHTLKGSARAVGAWSLATIAESAERIKPLDDAAARGLVVQRIEEAAAAARRYIASLPQDTSRDV